MALHDVTAHRIVALHDTRPVDCLALETHRQPQVTNMQETIALHSLSLGIVVGHVTPSHRSPRQLCTFSCLRSFRRYSAC